MADQGAVILVIVKRTTNFASAVFDDTNVTLHLDSRNKSYKTPETFWEALRVKFCLKSTFCH